MVVTWALLARFVDDAQCVIQSGAESLDEEDEGGFVQGCEVGAPDLVQVPAREL